MLQRCKIERVCYLRLDFDENSSGVQTIICVPYSPRGTRHSTATTFVC